MGKRFLHIVAFLALTAGLGFTSCSKEDPAEPVENKPATVSMEKTATIVGYVVIKDDISASEPRYSAPSASDFKMYVTIPYKDLMGDSYKGVVTKWTSTDVTYDANTGKFTVVVPVGINKSDVTLTLASYSGTQRQKDGTSTVTKNGVWKAPAAFSANLTQDGEIHYVAAVKQYTFSETTGIKGDEF